MKTTTSKKIIEALDPIFARFGNPSTLRTDNGPQFVSTEFTEYLREQGIEHRRTTPLWPQANGEVERQNRTLLKSIKIARIEGKDWRQEIQKFLKAYRSTPQVTTGETPYKLMFGREMKSKLPELPRETTLMNEEIRDRDYGRKLTAKEYADKKRKAVENNLEPGDRVLLRQEKKYKFSPNYQTSPCRVIHKNGGEVTVQDPEGKIIKRNASFVKKYAEPEINDSEGNTNAGEDTGQPGRYPRALKPGTASLSADRNCSNFQLYRASSVGGFAAGPHLYPRVKTVLTSNFIVLHRWEVSPQDRISIRGKERKSKSGDFTDRQPPAGRAAQDYTWDPAREDQGRDADEGAEDNGDDENNGVEGNEDIADGNGGNTDSNRGNDEDDDNE
ncbi:hypothetical protein Bbelb_036100 [Branchiostoma belcheri]|nr:hypothetical protein Bbelb_036100 [Branchiostoma belcheri]